MDLIRKYQETDGAVGDSQKNLDHWNTSVVGNTEKMSKETLAAMNTMGAGMVTGMDSTSNSVLGTFAAMGAGAAQSTGYISDICANLFGSIQNQAIAPCLQSLDPPVPMGVAGHYPPPPAGQVPRFSPMEPHAPD